MVCPNPSPFSHASCRDRHLCRHCFCLSFSSTFQKLAVLSNTAVLLLYILCCLAALELRRRDVRGDGVPFNFPGATLVPMAAIGVIIWILTHATRGELEITGSCLAAAPAFS